MGWNEDSYSWQVAVLGISLLTGWLSHHDWVSLRWRGLDRLGWAQLTTVQPTVQVYCAVLCGLSHCHEYYEILTQLHDQAKIWGASRYPQSKIACIQCPKSKSRNFTFMQFPSRHQLWYSKPFFRGGLEEWLKIYFIHNSSFFFVIYDRLTNSTPVHFRGGTH